MMSGMSPTYPCSSAFHPTYASLKVGFQSCQGLRPTILRPMHWHVPELPFGLHLLPTTY